MEEIDAEGLGGKLDFLEHFAVLPDSRQALKVLYPPDEVLLLTLCAMLCGADGWVSVALSGQAEACLPEAFPAFRARRAEP